MNFKVRKRILSLVVAIALVITLLPMPIQAAVHPEDVSVPQLVNTYRSVELNSPMRQLEYYDIETRGFSMTVSGKTRDHYVQYRIAVRTPGVSKYLFDDEALGYFEYGNNFEKTLSFEAMEDGDYLVSVRFNNTGDGKFPSEAQMRYVPICKNERGVFVKRYQAIENENEALKAANKNLEMYYLDTSMADMAHELRNGRAYDKNDIARLTNEQQLAIKNFTLEIVGTEYNDYNKIRLIHDYLAEEIYYDVPYNVADATEKREMANTGKVTLNPYDLMVQLSEGNYAKTVCNGYAALFAAMTRALGIPCRTVRGRSLRIPGTAWNELSEEELAKNSHVWNEVYVNGKWIFVDVTRDCSNDFTGFEYKRQSEEIVRYSGFDPSAQAVAVAILYQSYRETVYATLDVPTVSAIPSRYEPIEVTWQPVSGAQYYKIYRSCGEGYYDEIATTVDTIYRDSNLKPGTRYYYKIAAVDSNNVETRKSEYKAVSVTAIPQVEMSEISSQEGEISIWFKKLEGITHYELYRSTSKNGTYSYVDEIESADELIEFTDGDGLIYGKTYYYKVRGTKGADKTPPLSEALACEMTMPTPELKSVSSKNQSVTLRWYPMEQATAYHIYASDSVDGTYEEVAEVDGETTVYKSDCLQVGTKVFYRVKAECARTESELSYHKAITVKPVELPTLRSVSEKKRVVTLRWNASVGAKEYQIYRGTTKEGTFKKVATVPANTLYYKSGKLTVSKKYYWKVKVVMTNGAQSDFSLHKAITVRNKE